MLKDVTLPNKVLRILPLWLGICLLQIFLKVRGRECAGSNTGSGYVIRDSMASDLEKQFANCTIVTRNIEIISLRDNIKIGFLDNIEEVKGYILVQGTTLNQLSMRKLRLIRGKYLFHGKSIHVEDNHDLERILLPSLREISDGAVRIDNNQKLCFMNSIDWKEIVFDETTQIFLNNLRTECPPCSANCKTCWSEDVCQQSRRRSCKYGCSEDGSRCCEKVCAGGCRRTTDDCFDCRHFRNDDECKSECPALTKYNIGTMKNEPNPLGRYHFENRCVKDCPRNTRPMDRTCVYVCPGGETDGVCADCTSNCPKVCKETSLSSISISGLRNCSVIDGPVKILSDMIAGREESIVPQLNDILLSVKKISDAVIIQGKHDNFHDLSCLRNLEVINGFREDSGTSLLISHTSLRNLKMTSLHTILNGDVWITDNDDLESLDLISLKYIEGSVVIKNNKNLCFVDNSTLQNITIRGHIFVGQNKEEDICKKENKLCHEECAGGCWGPGNKQCRFCRNFEFEVECIPTCKERPNLYANVTKCERCHLQCKDGCNGNRPFDCFQCLNAKDDNHCVERCPVNKYLDPVTKSCHLCHPLCKEGCSGPAVKFGSGGCHDCKLLYNTTRDCVDDANFDCSTTKYKKLKDLQVTTIAGVRVTKQINICYDCHPLCKTCSDEGSHACECRYVEYEGSCLDGCPPQHYKDGNNKCQLCHQECDDCYGSTVDTCYTCKNVRIYFHELGNTTQDLHLSDELLVSSFNISERFICNSTCPAHIPDKYDFMMDHVVQRRCTFDDVAKQTKQKVMIGFLVLGLIITLCVAVLIFFVRKRQKAKEEENEAKMQAQIEGLNAYELLTPSKVRHESMTSMKQIKDSELDKGEMIGSGNFGTVYNGIWHPEDEKIRVPVAIKVMMEGSMTTTHHKELLEEARVMASVSNPCCIRILAVCLTKEMMLITPLVAHGTMLEYVEKNKGSMGSHTMLKWAAQIARGMNYLENKGIVHRNLSARNILVQSINQVKISDFMTPKLASILNNNQKLKFEEEETKWLSIEVIRHRIFTHKSDVWSYGITLWELFTYGHRPYENISACDLADHLEMGERLAQPPICTIDVYMVMIKCWMADACSRPSFQELELEFSNMTRDPGRFLVIKGDKLMRIPSDFVEDNRRELIRQMNLSDSDDIICGDDYHNPTSFAFPYRSFSDKHNKLTSVMEEEETCFHNPPEYTNVPNKLSRHQFKHQSSSISSDAADGAFAHLEAATAVFEGSRGRKSSARYMGSPSSDGSNDLMTFPQTPRPPSLDEKVVIKWETEYANEVKGEEYCDPKEIREEYLEPLIKSGSRISYLDMKNTGICLDNPEYMGQFEKDNFSSRF